MLNFNIGYYMYGCFFECAILALSILSIILYFGIDIMYY